MTQEWQGKREVPFSKKEKKVIIIFPDHGGPSFQMLELHGPSNGLAPL